MLLPIKLICEFKKARRNGTCLIYFQYWYSQNLTTLLNTEIAIPARYFNKHKQVIQENLPEQFGLSAAPNGFPPMDIAADKTFTAMFFDSIPGYKTSL